MRTPVRTSQRHAFTLIETALAVLIIGLGIEAVVSVPGGAIRLGSLYLPNGNPVGSEKFSYKLAWFERLAGRGW